MIGIILGIILAREWCSSRQHIHTWKGRLKLLALVKADRFRMDIALGFLENPGYQMGFEIENEKHGNF